MIIRIFSLVVIAAVLTASDSVSQVTASSKASDVFRAAAPSVFVIETRGPEGTTLGIGSAFLVDGNRLVTNAHVIRGGAPYLRAGPVALPLDVVDSDLINDIAILRSGTPLEASPLPLARVEPEIGTAVFTIGNPQGLERSLSEGMISGIRVIRGRRLIQITAPISHGSSGGPVLLPDGHVAAVAVSFIEDGQNLNFAVPAALVEKLLAGKSDETSRFGQMLAELKELANRPYPQNDSAAWNRLSLARKDALVAAEIAATTGDELLVVAEFSAGWYEVELTSRIAEKALRRGTSKPDSARAMALAAWESQFVFNDTIPTSIIRRVLGLADTLTLHRPRDASAHSYRAQVLSRLPGRNAEALLAAKRSVEVVHADDDRRTWIYSKYHQIAAEKASASEDDAAFRRSVAAGLTSEYTSHAFHLYERKLFDAAGAAHMKGAEHSATEYFRAREYCNAGRAYWLADQVDEAIVALRNCLASVAKSRVPALIEGTYANRALASILNDRGVYAQGETHAKEARSIDPTDGWAAYEHARSLLALERNNEAAAAAEEAIRLTDGKYSSYHFIAGGAYFQMNDWPKCERAFSKAWELQEDKSEVAAAYNTGLCLARQGYYRDGAKWLDIVLAHDPKRKDRADIEAMARAWRSR